MLNPITYLRGCVEALPSNSPFFKGISFIPLAGLVAHSWKNRQLKSELDLLIVQERDDIRNINDYHDRFKLSQRKVDEIKAFNGKLVMLSVLISVVVAPVLLHLSLIGGKLSLLAPSAPWGCAWLLLRSHFDLSPGKQQRILNCKKMNALYDEAYV